MLSSCADTARRRTSLSNDDFSPIPARKRWGLVAGLVIAALFPIVTGGTAQGEPAAWAWVALFGLNALIAAFKPDIFL